LPHRISTSGHRCHCGNQLYRAVRERRNYPVSLPDASKERLLQTRKQHSKFDTNAGLEG